MSEKPTVVFLYACDHNGAFSAIPKLAKSFEDQGAKVRIIGDGKRDLTLSEVQRELVAVSGPAVLYIGAHGSSTPFSDHGVQGFIFDSYIPTDGNPRFFDDRMSPYAAENRMASTEELLAMVPDNYRAVIASSCYSGAAMDGAVRQLSSGTLFFATASDNYEGMLNKANMIVSMTSTHIGFNGNPLLPSDIWLAQLLAEHKPAAMGYYGGRSGAPPQDLLNEKGTYSTEDAAIVRTSRYNVPTQIAVGQGGVLDLEKYLDKLRNFPFSEGQIAQIVNRLDNALFAETLNDSSLLTEGHGDELKITNRAAHDIVRPVLARIQAGTVKNGDVDFPLAIAIAYAVDDNNPDLYNDRLAILTAPPTDTPNPVRYLRKDPATGEMEPYSENMSKYRRELAGLGRDLTDYGWLSQRHADGSSKLDIDGNGVINADDLEPLLKAMGVVRAEQIGNGNREISFQEFLDKAGGHGLPNIPAMTRKNETER